MKRFVSVAVLSVVGWLALAAMAAGQTEAASRAAQMHPPDSLGTISASSVSCPTTGLAGTACYALAISCPLVQDYTAYIKVITPANPVGTVIMTNGGDLTEIYEYYTYGTLAVQTLVNANLTAVELTFGLPFSSSPGWEYNANGAGVRATDCRYATAVQWVAQNLAAPTPLCATGSSAGGQVISEGLAHYGLGNYLKFAEITSGPPYGRVDWGCIDNVKPIAEYCSNTVIGMGVGYSNAVKFVDPAYPQPWCSTSLGTHSTQYQQQFLYDSVTAPDATLNYPNTTIRFLFGGQDDSGAIRQGMYFKSKITSTTSYGCVKDAPHSIPDVMDGANQIAADLIKYCHK